MLLDLLIFGSSPDWDFQNSPPFKRSTCLYVIISRIFKRFQCFNFETDFLENENLFQETEVSALS